MPLPLAPLLRHRLLTIAWLALVCPLGWAQATPGMDTGQGRDRSAPVSPPTASRQAPWRDQLGLNEEQTRRLDALLRPTPGQPDSTETLARRQQALLQLLKPEQLAQLVLLRPPPPPHPPGGREPPAAPQAPQMPQPPCTR